MEAVADQVGGLRLTGEDSMLGELVRAVLEWALESELKADLGFERHDRGGSGNTRNGTIAKTVQTGVGLVQLQVPWDRAGPSSRCWCPSGQAVSRADWTI